MRVLTPHNELEVLLCDDLLLAEIPCFFNRGLQNLICLLFIFADQIFIDPTFFGIFVCGPLQSLVVNVCTR